MAQLVEHQLPKLNVAGSSPVARSIFFVDRKHRNNQCGITKLSGKKNLAGIHLPGNGRKTWRSAEQVVTVNIALNPFEYSLSEDILV